MNQLKGGGEFPVQMARYVVEHSGTMEDGPVPVFSWYLILCEIDAGHMDNITPGAFNKTVGALYFSGGCNNLGLVVVYPS